MIDDEFTPETIASLRCMWGGSGAEYPSNKRWLHMLDVIEQRGKDRDAARSELATALEELRRWREASLALVDEPGVPEGLVLRKNVDRIRELVRGTLEPPQ